MPASLVVTRYDSPDKADRAFATLQRLQSEGKYHLLDGAIVTWQPGHRRPMTRPMVSAGMPGTLDHAFWGMLLGLLFFVPPEAAGVSTDAPSLHGILASVGVNADFVNHVRERVTEGTSALFTLRDVADYEAVRAALAELNPELVATNLPPEQESSLREMFGYH